MTKYQQSKVDIISTLRQAKGKSMFSKWVAENFSGKFIVTVNPIDIEGTFNKDPLKNRGYEFAGAGKDHVERGLLVGKKNWFKAFSSEDEAIHEIEIICEEGI